MTLRIGFQVWGQHVGWDELMTMGRRIDELGFDSLWSNDHLLPVAGGGPVALEVDRGPVWDGWMTLAGWADRTSRVRLGCLVSGVVRELPTTPSIAHSLALTTTTLALTLSAAATTTTRVRMH